MSYQLNKTDGTLLTDLIDGQIDDTSTNLVLVGRNYTGYGEYFNENMIKLLENFSNSAAPSNPLTGQIWWDTNEQRLKVYDGSVWKASGGPYVQDSRPQMVAGDLWIDNLNRQVYAYDGGNLGDILIGPSYTEQQGISGFKIESILDEQSRSRTVAVLYIGGTAAGYFSNIQFTPTYSQRIEGLITASNPDGTVFPGFNIVDKANFKYRGIAESANALVTGAGAIRTADSFLPSNANGVTVGTLTIQNSGGLTIGLSQNNVQKVVGPRFYIENQLTDHDLSLRVKSNAYGNITVDAIYIDASEGKVGIFTTDRAPEYTLDVEGDLRVTGDLLVEGATTQIDVNTLQVQDINIELAITSDGTILVDSAVDGGGIILKASGTDKTLTYNHANTAWMSNQNFNLLNDTLSYKINGVEKLSFDRLEPTVRYAYGLEEIGTLNYIDVDNVNINGKTITSSLDLTIISSSADGNGRGINVTAAGDIHITDSQKITGLANPTEEQDATTKIYVDTQIAVEPIVFSMDITGLGTGETLEDAVRDYLQDMYPAISINNGKIARIHTTSYAGATVDGVDVESAKNITLIAVDANGTENESVVQDIVFGPASGSVVLEPARTLMTYQSSGTAWVHQSTTTYS